MSIKKDSRASKETANQEKDARYTLSQLKASKRYTGRCDLLEALLEERKSYSIPEVDAAIDKFLKGKVD